MKTSLKLILFLVAIATLSSAQDVVDKATINQVPTPSDTANTTATEEATLDLDHDEPKAAGGKGSAPFDQ